MKRSAVVEVDRMLQELTPPTPLTDDAVVAGVIDVLGQVAGDVTKTIADGETAKQAFEHLAAVDVARQLYRCATVFASIRRMLELRAIARRSHS